MESDEDDLADSKKLIFRKVPHNRQHQAQKKPEFRKVVDFESLAKKSHPHSEALSYDLFDGEDTPVFNAKTEVSPSHAKPCFHDNKSTSKRKAIFSSKRQVDTGKESKSRQCLVFNLNPNTEDSNYKVAKGASLNDACIFDSNSSCSNSPTSVSRSSQVQRCVIASFFFNTIAKHT